MESLKMFGKLVSLSLQTQLQYRLSFLMQSLAHLMIYVAEFIGIYSLFQRFGSLNEWTLPEVALFYGMVSISFSLADSLGRGLANLGQLIKAGDLDRYLLRPRSVLLQLMGFEFGLDRIGRFLQGMVVLIYGLIMMDVPFSLEKLFLLGWALLGSLFLFVGLMLLQATLSFWTVESLEVMNCLTFGGVETAQYPLSIYEKWFRNFFTFVVPLACVNYYPLLAVMEKEDPLGSGELVPFLAPSGGILFFLAVLLLWRYGLSKYTSTGS